MTQTLENLKIRKAFKRLSRILETGESQIVQNEKLGDILGKK